MSVLSLEFAKQQKIKLNYPLQQLPYCWFKAYSHLLRQKCSMGERWSGHSDDADQTTCHSVSVVLQSFLSGCGCAEAAWRFFPAAASVTCSGNGTRTTSQKATLSPTLSEWVGLLENLLCVNNTGRQKAANKTNLSVSFNSRDSAQFRVKSRFNSGGSEWWVGEFWSGSQNIFTRVMS